MASAAAAAEEEPIGPSERIKGAAYQMVDKVRGICKDLAASSRWEPVQVVEGVFCFQTKQVGGSESSKVTVRQLVAMIYAQVLMEVKL